VPVPVAGGAVLRSGIVRPRIEDPATDNILVENIPAGTYMAHKQCQGEFVDLGAKNFWWVQITVGDVTGWVSAINIPEGDDTPRPIPNVPHAPAVNN
jgi:hypothetical protein